MGVKCNINYTFRDSIGTLKTMWTLCSYAVLKSVIEAYKVAVSHWQFFQPSVMKNCNGMAVLRR